MKNIVLLILLLVLLSCNGINQHKVKQINNEMEIDFQDFFKEDLVSIRISDCSIIEDEVITSNQIIGYTGLRIKIISPNNGRIDVLINNAGVASMNHLMLTPLSAVERIYKSNVFAPFILIREVAKVMSKAKQGRIAKWRGGILQPGAVCIQQALSQPSARKPDTLLLSIIFPSILVVIRVRFTRCLNLMRRSSD